MRDELISLKRSNSLLARRKQQWSCVDYNIVSVSDIVQLTVNRMEVASQTKVVLEENKTLINQYKAQQLMITDLRTQHHSKGLQHVHTLHFVVNDNMMRQWLRWKERWRE